MAYLWKELGKFIMGKSIKKYGAHVKMGNHKKTGKYIRKI